MAEQTRQRGKGLIFVGGCPRSGTTLVQNMLDSHPDVCGGPEFDRVPDIVRLRNKLRASVDSGRIGVFCSTEDIDREIGALIENLLLPYAEKRGCGLISEKTPWNVLMFQDLLEIFPEARFVFCVRDPRAVVASMLQVNARYKGKGLNPPAFGRNVAASIETIKKTNDAGFTAARQSDRVFTTVYERLVDDPERETARLCDFLRLGWSEQMINPAGKSHDGERLLDNLWYTREMYDRNPEPNRAHRWKEQLTSAEQAVVTMSFESNENLEAIGYKLSAKTLPVAYRTVYGLRFRLLGNLESVLLGLVRLLTKYPPAKRMGLRLLSRVEVVRRYR